MLPKVLVHHDVQQVIAFPPNGADPPLAPLSPQMPQQQQQSIGSIQPPPLTEEKFMDLFMLFSHATGLRLNEQDFKIEGYQVNPWDLHKTIFARNGFDMVRFRKQAHFRTLSCMPAFKYSRCGLS
jgi:hypothetical protein